MANNYTSFSFQVKCPSEEAANTLEDSLASAMESGTEADPDRWLNLEHAEAEGDTVWIAEEEGTNLEFLADVLQDYLQHNDPHGSIGFTWAETCSKLRVDEFGGGAVFITHDNQVWLNSYHWLQIQESNRKPLPAPALAT
ncbi:MAG: hypothetical protein CMA70_04815 [Euryarchaeota archaeon]|nr:hypothetical protein [Euryarchaeota archaeon]